MPYLTLESCTLDKPHYGILFLLINQWEEEYWPHADEAICRLVPPSGRRSISLGLFHRLNMLFANTLDYLFQRRLSAENPLLGRIPSLVPQSLKDSVAEKLYQELFSSPELLFEGRDPLRTFLKETKCRYTAFITELLERILADRSQIEQALLEGRHFAQLLSLDLGGGDLHQDGRCTVVLESDAGKFLYKPHSLQNDVVLGELVQRFFSDTLLIPKALNFGSYGYAAFAETRFAEGEKACRDFFRHLGGAMALLIMLGANDFHTENMLSCGELPALIDLETVLAPSILQKRSAASPKLQAALKHCQALAPEHEYVLIASALLPKMQGGKEYSVLLNREENSILPRINGEVQTADRYLEDLSAGYREAYQRCIHYRTQIEDILCKFEGSSVRMLLRNTDTYIRQQQKLYTVTALSSPDVTEKLLQHFTFFLPQFSDAENENIAAAERSALLRGDVPYFTLPAQKSDLYCDGKRLIENGWVLSPLQNALERLRRMNDAGCAYELKLIRLSLSSALVPEKSPLPPVKLGQAPAASMDQYKKEAAEICQSLLSACVATPSGHLAWFGGVGDDNSFTRLTPETASGSLGICRFLAEYCKVFPDDRVMEVLLTTLQEAETLAEAFLEIRSPLEFDSHAGVLDFASLIGELTRIGLLLDRRKDTELARRITAHLAKFSDKMPSASDFYSGIAGLLYACSHPIMLGDTECEQTIRLLADELLHRQTLPFEDGPSSWDTLGKKRVISGLGHGVAGIGIALEQAGKLVKEERYLNAARDAFTIEHALYSEKLQTWPDLRDTPVADSAMHGICSGAPGIGMICLQRLSCGDMSAGTDLERALKACCKQQPTLRDHLCCGNAATVEFLLSAAAVLHKPELAEQADVLLSAMLARKQQTGAFRFTPPVFRNFSPLGLHFGQSGIGHILLHRLHPGLQNVILNIP